MENVSLDFTDGALVAIAREALKRRTGARGLHTLLEETMLDVMFDIPSKKITGKLVTDEDVVYGKAQPRVVRSGRENLLAA